LGILAIVAGHVWLNPAVLDALYTWHVPIFFFLAGWLWKPGRTVRAEIVRRGRALLYPYAFWLVTIAAAKVLTDALTGNISMGSIAAGLYGGGMAAQPFTTFWFVFVLYASAVIFRAIEGFPLQLRAVLVVVGVASGTLFGHQLSITPLAVGSALPAMVFLAAGQLCAWVTVRCQISPYWGVVSIGFGALLVLLGVEPFDIKSGNWGSPGLSIIMATAISWGLTLVAVPLAQRLGRGAQKFTWFALTGFTIVLVHPLVIWLLQPFIPAWTLYIAAVIVPCAIASFARRTRWSHWITGTVEANKTAESSRGAGHVRLVSDE